MIFTIQTTGSTRPKLGPLLNLRQTGLCPNQHDREIDIGPPAKNTFKDILRSTAHLCVLVPR